ncbi:D-alanyl-D-alanine carboxypeptidase/D-alanyl-D-alanine-endopeptidase (penicillin-binding protein 4) [Arthrobacter sp. V4I6]|uniref:D-alanyl-D-alanine carboxypeptidase/D-alanyl-D-alanine endopeptidase n=1 Tax=unclassified Arthrobacter TaxID=235627 RepID=UPI002785251D|nr:MULTISPECIES: D-alanyl-D-alanine carboxypeptidase/D-alanyl-D-alanine-endopeptidase [unclassified Arthrobacter]MDQ0823198.1 D-alanyl-D-alanine carboxypeptidase/D-alanyl-D-alanine-endopeptidase (penicillin-binding protein 4) [Arthrobacter sp. V1I7]MDQ0852828.1 D-alanyl-D-alanine carboxypeptidase/D-alanyl-D-alanine-endopeptidase (penicillin-binding protein 4) [Arthrobacter sp. V4I6]
MKRGTSSGGKGQVPGMLRGILPMLFLTLLVLALAVPAGLAMAPAFIDPNGSNAAPTVPPWQQLPTTLAAGSGNAAGIQPLSDAAPVPEPGALTAQLNETLKPDGAGTFTGVVQDAATGKLLFDRAGDEARVPASNMKLLTAAAALRTLGADRRFSTRVLAGSAPGTVVLSGGGDVLLGAGESAPNAVLGHAGLATLAQSTVRALQKDGVSGTVTILLDDSLFSGASLNPAWSLQDVAAGEMAPLFPLALNSARFDPAKTTGPRPQDAAMHAAEAFSAQLSAAGAPAGLTMAPGVARSPGATDGAAPDPRVLAEVESATVGQQVDLLLRTSDNYLTEVVGRMTALAGGKPASNDGAVAAVLEQLEELGVATATLRAADVSGLALANQVSARQLAEVVRAITSGTDTRLRAALSGFPVAGLTGTLGDRYLDPATARGAGLVRAKTGTLNTVTALSGYVVDSDGRLLVFSFIGNGLTPGAANKTVLDRTAAVLAGCGCR